MSGAPDFDTLRAERNRRMLERLQKFADEEGIPLQSIRTSFDPSACYCACPDGPCEHRWDGEVWESGDGLCSVTCSRCACTAFSHDMRTMP